MSETLVPDTGAVEAVIISGPHKGQIVRVVQNEDETWTIQESTEVMEALRELDRAVLGVLDETRGLKQDLKQATEEMARA